MIKYLPHEGQDPVFPKPSHYLQQLVFLILHCCHHCFQRMVAHTYLNIHFQEKVKCIEPSNLVPKSNSDAHVPAADGFSDGHWLVWLHPGWRMGAQTNMLKELCCISSLIKSNCKLH